MEPLQSRELEKTWSDGEQFSQPAENVASDKSEVREEGKSEEGQDTTPLLEKIGFFFKKIIALAIEMQNLQIQIKRMK